jgi:hypothetical protein
MKFKLVEYPYGREIGFNQDVVWFIQGTCDNRKWDNYIWSYKDCCPSIILEDDKLLRTCPQLSAYLTIKEANEAFDKITNYYRAVIEGKNISILREVEI